MAFPYPRTVSVVSERGQESTPVRLNYRPLVGCAVFFLLLLGGYAGLLWWNSQRGLTVAKVERWIKEEVPPGCDRQFVEAWFDRHGISHDWTDDTEGAKRDHKTLPQLAGLRSEELSGMVYGKISGPEV